MEGRLGVPDGAGCSRSGVETVSRRRRQVCELGDVVQGLAGAVGGVAMAVGTVADVCAGPTQQGIIVVAAQLVVTIAAINRE